MPFFRGNSSGSSGSGSLLSGGGAPPSGNGLDALDGINDPWRWSPAKGGWIGPSYEVTWEAGAFIPYPLVGTRGDVGTLEIGVTTAGSLAGSNDGEVSVDHVTRGGTAGNDDARENDLTAGDAAATFTDAGSGVAFVGQYETGFTHTTAPEPGFDPLDFLGEDFTVGDPYEWPDVTTGNDGDFYVDTATRNLYGPRADGVWEVFATLPAPE